MPVSVVARRCGLGLPFVQRGKKGREHRARHTASPHKDSAGISAPDASPEPTAEPEQRRGGGTQQQISSATSAARSLSVASQKTLSREGAFRGGLGYAYASFAIKRDLLTLHPFPPQPVKCRAALEMDNAPPYTHLSVPVYSLATPPVRAATRSH